MTPGSQPARVHAFLRENVFTRGLPPRVINMLAAEARLVNFLDGDYLFRANQKASIIYLLKEGSVWLHGRDASGALRVWRLGEGALLGWSCLTEPYTYLLDARSEGVVQALAISSDRIRELLDLDHDLGYYIYPLLMKAAAQRLAPYNDLAVHNRALPTHR